MANIFKTLRYILDTLQIVLWNALIQGSHQRKKWYIKVKIHIICELPIVQELECTRDQENIENRHDVIWQPRGHGIDENQTLSGLNLERICSFHCGSCPCFPNTSPDGNWVCDTDNPQPRCSLWCNGLDYHYAEVKCVGTEWFFKVCIVCNCITLYYVHFEITML